jgi:hypothetical protein
MRRLLNRFRILYPEEPSHHCKAVLEGPKRLSHQKSNDSGSEVLSTNLTPQVRTLHQNE